MRKQFADSGAALAVLLKFEGRAEQAAGLLGERGDARAVEGERLAVVAGEARFGIEGVQMRRTAEQEQHDYPFGARREMRRPGRERVCRRGGGLVGEERGQSQGAEAGA